MKNTLLLFITILTTSTCISQGVFSNKTSFALEKILQEYPDQFRNIKGPLISSGPGLAEYKSTLTIPGSLSATIVETGSVNNESVSWQSVLYTGNEFNAAKTRFEELFSQIKNTIIKPAGAKPAIVNGEYKTPAADNAYTTISFDLLPAVGALKKIRISLTLKSTNGHWEIVLSVNDSEKNAATGLTVK